MEFDSPIGRNDGTVNSHRYFECPENHGVLTNPKKVKRVDAHGNDIVGPAPPVGDAFATS